MRWSRSVPGGVELEVEELDGERGRRSAAVISRAPPRRWWWLGLAALPLGIVTAGLFRDGGTDVGAPGPTSRPLVATTVPPRPVPRGAPGPTGTTVPTALARAIGRPGPVLGVPTGVELVVGELTGPGLVVHLDDGSVERLEREPREGRGPAAIRPLARAEGGIVASEEDGGVVFLARDGTETDLAPDLWVVVSASGRAIWTFDHALREGVVTRVESLAERRVVTIPLAVEPVAATDDTLLVEGTGGVYGLSLDGDARRLAPGGFLGANGRQLASRDCDEALRCSVVVRDIASGEVMSRHPAPALVTGAGALSPDARWLAVLVFEPSGAWDVLLLDLRSGDALRAGLLPAQSYSRTMPQWTDDGRFVLFGQGSTLVAFATDTRSFTAYDLAPLEPVGAVVMR